MPRTVSATEARIHLGELMRHAVQTGEPVIVERDGSPLVAMLSVTEYQRLSRGQQPGRWQDLVQRARDQAQADLGERDLPAPEQILARVREERDEQLLALR